MDGLETYLRLKEINPDITVVMMTAYRDEVRDIVDKALAASATGCLYKPFDPSQVVGLVNQVGGRLC
jgi:DNA-binding NarL/FixJ family response regulator